MTNYRRRLDLARKTLCLSCCKEMEHGYCQACWEQQGRASREHGGLALTPAQAKALADLLKTIEDG